MEVLKTQTTGKTTVNEHVRLSYEISNDGTGKATGVRGLVMYEGETIGYITISSNKLFALNISQTSDITEEELTKTLTVFIADSYKIFNEK